MINVRFCRSKTGDVEDCVVEDLNQGQFTPLSEALCLVILELTSANQNATIDTVRSALKIFFANIQPPTEHIVYDAIANLMSDNKVRVSWNNIILNSNGCPTFNPVNNIRLRNVPYQKYPLDKSVFHGYYQKRSRSTFALDDDTCS